MDLNGEDRRTPGIPGKLGALGWVDSPDYVGRPEDRRGLVVYDVDPAPLARLIAMDLQIIDGDAMEAARAIAEDDRDGPIHIAHLIAACEYAARQVGGHMPVAAPGSGFGLVADLGRSLRDGGLPGATAAAAAMDHTERARVLDALLDYCLRPITALRIDLTGDMIRNAHG
jgi:hypothetical protein